MTDYPTYWDKRVSIDKIVSSRTFLGLHPTMQQRVRDLIEESGGAVGLGQGLRDPSQQLQMFLSRHVPDPNGPYHYDGQRWRRLPGMAAAAPPGASMHEIGLAADMTGDMGWLHDNVARFALQTFESVNNEPWHLQPSELSRSRSSYERQPSWGLPPWGGPATDGLGPAVAAGTAVAAVAAVAMLSPALRARPGDTGPAVDVLIEALIARSLLPDGADRRDHAYGPDDVAVVEEFQRANGLTVDGIVGPQTWGKLLTVVKPGDVGPKVVVVQVTLIARALMDDSPAHRDGQYGPVTQGVVRQFQTAARLSVDAEVGPATWTALIGAKRRIPVTTRGGGDDDGDGEGDEVDLDDIDMVAVYAGQPAE